MASDLVSEEGGPKSSHRTNGSISRTSFTVMRLTCQYQTPARSLSDWPTLEPIRPNSFSLQNEGNVKIETLL